MKLHYTPLVCFDRAVFENSICQPWHGGLAILAYHSVEQGRCQRCAFASSFDSDTELAES